MANKPNPANFTPDVPDFPNVPKFLPCYGKFDLTTYIQGASDYEIMCNLVQLYNTMAKGYNDVEKLSTDTQKAYVQLQNFVNTWFDDLNVVDEVNVILHKMVDDGSLAQAVAQSNTIPPAVAQYLNSSEGKQNLSNVTATKIDTMAQDGSLANVVAQTGQVEPATKEFLGTNEGIAQITPPINSSLRQWLDDHPEATTTVQDGAITKPKINNQLWLTIDNDYVVPEMFGAVGDGVTDDTAAFKECLKHRRVYVPGNSYLITETLTISKEIELTGSPESKIVFTGDLLFNVSTYYQSPFTISNLTIDSNKNKILLVSNDAWGASIIANHVKITNASNECVSMSGAFNVNFTDVIIAGSSESTGTLVKLGIGEGLTFSNLINFGNCTFAANKVTNIIEVGHSYNINLMSCTFEGFKTAITGAVTSINCWFEKGDTCFASNSSASYVIAAHYANVTAYLNTGSPYSFARLNCCRERIPWYTNVSNSLLEECFKNPVANVWSVITEGIRNNNYDQMPILTVDTNKIISTAPINTIFAKSESASVGFGLSTFQRYTEGYLELTIRYVRFNEAEAVQQYSYLGIIDNRKLIEISHTNNLESTPVNVSLNFDSAYLTISTSSTGNCIGWITITRLGY